MRLSDGASQSQTIYADDSAFQSGDHYVYKEITAFSFNKNTTGPMIATNPPVVQSIPEPEQIGHTGVSASTVVVTGSAFDYRVYWNGQVTCYLDYVIVDNVNANSTFSGADDVTINQEVDNFKTNPALGRFKIRDEIDPDYYGQYLTIGYVEQLIKSRVTAAGYPTKTGFHYNTGLWQYARTGSGQEYIGRDIAWTQNNQSIVDIYPINENVLLPDQSNYTQSYQDVIQYGLIQYLRMNISYANKYVVPFWFCPQAHSNSPANNPLREPTTMELRQMVNLGLVYGVKGIHYFLYWTYDNGTEIMYGLVNQDGTPRHTIYSGTSYAGDKWEMVKSINQKLTAIGPTLIDLTWQNTYSIHLSQGYPSFISNVRSYTTGGTQDSYPSSTYVELGAFKKTSEISNNNLEYFFVVNRRTHPTESRQVRVYINKATSIFYNWKVTEVGTSNSWIIAKSGNFITSYEPGEGKLFKLEPVIIAGGTLAYSENIPPGTSINVQGTVTVPSGKTLTIQSGSELDFYNNASLNGDGSIIANGTPSERITFDFVSGLGGIEVQGGSTKLFTYCNVINAGNGIALYSGYPTIDHCNISECWTGIDMGYSDGTISNNVIQSCSNNGIRLYTSSPNVYGNTVVDCNNGDGIQCINYASPSIHNNTISGNHMGIYIYTSEPDIIDNDILENYGNGVYGEASNLSPLIKGNTIIKTSSSGQYHQYQGIILGNSSDPFITENDIQGFLWGLYHGGGGTSYFTDADYSTPSRNNRLIDNTYSLCTAWGSTTIAGDDTEGAINTIDGNYLDAKAYQNGILHAQFNYWGYDGIQVSSYQGGYINTDDELDYDPWDEYIMTASSSSEGVNENLSFKNHSTILNEDDILRGINFEKEGRIDEAVLLYKQLIEKDSRFYFALSSLARIEVKFSKSEIYDYLEGLLNTGTKHKTAILNTLASIELVKMDNDGYANAMELYDNIIREDPRSYYGINARFEKFFAALHYKNDRELAGKLLNDLEALGLAEDEHLMRLDIAEQLYNRNNSVTNSGGNTQEQVKANNQESTKDNLPKEYSLLGNYPNPFNPSTTISYALPYQSSVELVIYDIIGRVVKSFNISSQSAGYQSIVWDGRNEIGNSVASGIYLYRVSIKSLENNKTFVKTAKLMMLK